MTLLVTNVSSNDTVDGKPWLPARHVSCVHLAVERVSRTGKIVAFERANVHRDKRAMSLPVSAREKRRRRCLRPVDETRRKEKKIPPLIRGKVVSFRRYTVAPSRWYVIREPS